MLQHPCVYSGVVVWPSVLERLCAMTLNVLLQRGDPGLEGLWLLWALF